MSKLRENSINCFNWQTPICRAGGGGANGARLLAEAMLEAGLPGKIFFGDLGVVEKMPGQSLR